jgi:preprotein translocase subunit SecD
VSAINHYPLWKNLLIVLVVAGGALLASPNLYGDDPAIQISHPELATRSAEIASRVAALLEAQKVAHLAPEVDEGRMLVRFADATTQLKANDLLREGLGEPYKFALNLAPRTPRWMQELGLRPMNLGLDLRGGVHFLLQVDMKAALDQALERYEADSRAILRKDEIRYAVAQRDGDSVLIRFREVAARDAARKTLAREFPELAFEEAATETEATLRLTLTPQRLTEIRSSAVQQNVTTLRKRVNELGVAEPIVQQQGAERIVVQLPGVQDTVAAREILGATATLEFRLVSDEGASDLNAKLYRMRDGGDIYLKREVIVRGDQLTDAQSTFDTESGSPAVSVSLDAAGGRRMAAVTAANINKPMAIVFIENRSVTRKGPDGQPIIERKRTEEVISAPIIRGAFSSRFQVTGVAQDEARQLSLLLRAGALAAPVDVVEDRTVGPSLGEENIRVGVQSAAIGFGLIVLIMGLYYGTMGWLANIAMTINLVLLIALLSALQATLTLPGIAGMVLTVGMAVDANVLIYERIREELKRGQTAQAAIHAGFERAWGTILDANVTHMIAALVLFGLGSGPVKGFAITLSLGILTSVWTSVQVSRAMVNIIYGSRRVERLSV